MSPASVPRRPALRWPLPALLAWGLAWVAFVGGVHAGWPPLAAMLVATLLAVVACGHACTRWRRLVVAAGFPLSLAAWHLGAAAPAWAWLLPLALLAALYPRRTWGDAPVFPTPRGALRGLAAHAPLPAGARILDAGCGLGDALRELRREYPQAALTGVEWSRPLRLLAALRARFATVRRADLWATDWSGFDLVYVFQRPETMARIGRKAVDEMHPGAWLVSLEFPVPGWRAVGAIDGPRSVWVYRVGTAAPRRPPARRVRAGGGAA